MQKLTKLIIAKRVVILALLAALVYLAISYYHIGLGYIVLLGIGSGFFFGKIFCRWMCPMGFIMELMMGGSDKFANMYQYHKMGCPIAWVSGWLNKYSLFRIKVNADTCVRCGKCDKACYISTLEPDKYSLYKEGKKQSGASYSCSKCLKCVASCPNGSLSYKI